MDKHNLLSDGKNTLIFDHELAFSFLLFLFPNVEPWTINDDDLKWIRNHVFYKIMLERKPNFEGFVKKLDLIDNLFWEKADALIPEDWKTTKFDKIRKHIEVVKNNKDVFLQQLNNLVI